MRATPFFVHPFLHLAASAGRDARLNGRPEADRYGSAANGEVSDWPR